LRIEIKVFYDWARCESRRKESSQGFGLSHWKDKIANSLLEEAININLYSENFCHIVDLPP
jgi:hypothetical protein